MNLHGRDKILRGLGQLDQMHPAGHVAVGDTRRGEVLRAAQRGRPWRYHDPKFVDVTTKAPCEVLHVIGDLRQR